MSYLKDDNRISEFVIEHCDIRDYSYSVEDGFSNVPDIAKPLLERAKATLRKIEKMLYAMPAFINVVKASIPEQMLQAVLTDEQKAQIANGALRLMTKKDGSLMANLVDTSTNKIVAAIPLKSIELAPALSDAMASYATQMQMAQIAEEIHAVQLAIEEVRQGQEYDRLALAYSCQQKMLQAMQIRNPELKTMALMRIASDAEDSRNMLMQSQHANLMFIREQPESFWGKLVLGATPEKVSQRMGEIRESLLAVNAVSLTEALAYQELGESEAARQSLLYYSTYLQHAYLSAEGFVERLDLLDPSPENYWSKALPEISDKIQALPYVGDMSLLEGEY